MKLSNIQSVISRENVYFHKIFRYLAVTTFILFFCFTLIISLFTVNRYTREVQSSSIQNMDASLTASESALEGLYNYCYTLFHNTAAVNDILYADSFSSELSIKFSSLSGDFLNYYNLIESIYLINFQADMVFSNITTRQTFASFYDQDILHLLENAPGHADDFLFLPRPASSGAPADVISLVFRCKNGNAFVINLKRSAYEEMLNHNAISSDTIVINSRGLAINGSDELDFAADVSDTDWYQGILAADRSEGSLSVRLRSQRYTVFYRKNTAFGFTYATMLAASPFSTKNTMLYSTLAFFVLFMFAGFALSLFLSYTLYLPISNLTRLLKSYGKQADRHPDEISYLTDTVTTLVNTSHKSQKQLYLTEKAKLLCHILTVANYYNTLTKETLTKYGFFPDAEYYQVILFSLDSAPALLSSNPSDYRLMLDSLQNIASELLPDALYCEVENGILAYILFPDTDEGSRFTAQITRTRQCMNEYFQETVTVGLGETCESPSDLHESYMQARIAMRYRFLTGNNHILNYSDFPTNNSSNLMLQEQKEIISALLSCKETQASEKLEAYFNLLKETHIDNMIMNIMALNAAFQNAEEQSGIQSMSQLSYDSDPYNHYTINEIREQFLQIIRQDIARLQEIRQNAAAKPQIIEEVTAYVEANVCSPDLTVENIASRIHLSTNYLRNIFKEHMGISLSKYITDRKITYACKILVETDDSIQSISERLDYTSATYFYTYFKRNTGMTPNQYRELYRRKGINRH